MVFKFLIISDEIDNFKRCIEIDSDSTFLDLCNSIIESVNFKKDIFSFFICDDDWTKRKEITLIEMDINSEEDSYIMEECILNDYLEYEKQKLMFVFDYIEDRAFYIELSEIITGRNLSNPVCTVSNENPPIQYKEITSSKEIINNASNPEEILFGDEKFNIDELDEDGFEGLDNIKYDLDSENF